MVIETILKASWMLCAAVGFCSIIGVGTIALCFFLNWAHCALDDLSRRIGAWPRKRHAR